MFHITVEPVRDHPVSFFLWLAYKVLMVSLLYFGRFSDVAQPETVALPEHVRTAADLIDWLCDKHAGFSHEWSRAGARIAVNKEIILNAEEQIISDGDEIAFMSALSGG